ncbi:MAG: hypothetical protein ACYCS8_12240 [Acidithiobacillus sp.]
MRIIASKQNEFGSKTFVMEKGGSVYMLETIGGVVPHSPNSPEVVFYKDFGDAWGGFAAARAICAMRLHK